MLTGSAAPSFSFGNALQFDGVNDLATSTTKTITGTYSIHFWVKFKTLNNILFGSSFPYLLFPRTNEWFWQGFDVTEIFAYSAPLNTWLAVTISRNSSNLCTLYINGAEIDTCTRTNNFIFNDIGGYSTFVFDGIIDELYIYDGVEADGNDNAAFWNNGHGIDMKNRAGFETPDRYYSFNEEGAATIATDEGSDSANLTLTNFSTPPSYFVPH